ncbi:hypothetical protein [Komagataeibacter kakiaceti]|uniref:hypothetical protein n=1 Tax=Komagataeibacter kakiaceti TaxID=943261 RepID=UPI0011DD56A4|nr:hypothetical protein [Komagataeibacter kakiaceti]
MRPEAGATQEIPYPVHPLERARHIQADPYTGPHKNLFRAAGLSGIPSHIVAVRSFIVKILQFIFYSVGSITGIIFIIAVVISSLHQHTIETAATGLQQSVMASAQPQNTDSSAKAFLDELPGPDRIEMYPYDAAATNQSCAEQWTKRGVLDQEMENYCVNEEREGYARLVETAQKIGGFSWGKPLFDSQTAKWTKRGVVDYNEVNFVLSQDYDAYLDLKYAYSHEGINTSALAQAMDIASRSNSGISMIAFSYKRIIGKN